LRIKFDFDSNLAFAGPVEKALHLGHDVELVLAAVTDVKIELAGLEIVAIHHLDGVEASKFEHGVGTVPDEGAEQVAGANDERPRGTPDYFERTPLRAPPPAFRIKRRIIVAMAIDPAQVERGHEPHGDFDTVLVLDRLRERGAATHRHADQ